MTDSRRLFLAVLLLATFVPPGVHGQSCPSTQVLDQLEFFEGHAYMGSDRVKWEHDKLVFVTRVADMKGKGAFVETVEQLSPAAEAWRRFWARIDALGVWQWKSDYSNPKRDLPDGDSWALTLRWGARQLKSKGYNAVPDGYSEFRAAVYTLKEDAQRHERK